MKQSEQQSFKTLLVNNNKICPVCGSEMTRDMSDNPHDIYCGHYNCKNKDCSISVTIRN